ncbi:carbon-nitrogen hydrolase family protein [Limnobacter sp.]|uniref:carbon-nitrogen hydrolase family protein n=1 Tax=Limnobacter sp. TaxID=2003368 RepID=UPI003515682C
MQTTLNMAALQMVSTPDVQENLAMAGELMQQAAKQGAKLVLLPEYFCLMGQRDTDKLAIAEAHGDGPIQRFLGEQAKLLGLHIVAGTIPIQSPSADRVYNTSLVFHPNGSGSARYDKIHLFCFKRGEESYDEGKVLLPGSTPVVADCDGFKVGLSVCYDLRFPELYRAMGPVDLIVMPAAFTYTTGKAHWEVLMRARAIENQCYVLACGQGGVHPSGRRTWGHSMVVNPWGEVEQVLEEGPGVVMGTLDPAKILDVRNSLPALRHRVLQNPPRG